MSEDALATAFSTTRHQVRRALAGPDGLVGQDRPLELAEASPNGHGPQS